MMETGQDEVRREAPALCTRRLLLRAFAESDVGALYACCRNPLLGDNAGWKPHSSPGESRRVLEEVFLRRPTTWAVTDGGTGRLVGAVGLLPDPKRECPGVAMLGYWLDEACWGRGLMTEAARAVVGYGFSQLGLEMVTATCYPHNERSRRVLERLGFRFEGVIHRAVQELNADKKYKLILNATSLVDADSLLDITPLVLAKVNELYAADKKADKE